MIQLKSTTINRKNNGTAVLQVFSDQKPRMINLFKTHTQKLPSEHKLPQHNSSHVAVCVSVSIRFHEMKSYRCRRQQLQLMLLLLLIFLFTSQRYKRKLITPPKKNRNICNMCHQFFQQQERETATETGTEEKTERNLS